MQSTARIALFVLPMAGMISCQMMAGIGDTEVAPMGGAAGIGNAPAAGGQGGSPIAGSAGVPSGGTASLQGGRSVAIGGSAGGGSAGAPPESGGSAGVAPQGGQLPATGGTSGGISGGKGGATAGTTPVAGSAGKSSGGTAPLPGGSGGDAAPGGGGSTAGGASSGGTTHAGAGGLSTGGSDQGGETPAGGQGGSSGCVNDSNQCAEMVRQRCVSGQWQNDPCPLDQPACELGACVLRGPTMIHISSLDVDYYIDSTEVTVGQYKQFLLAKGTDTSGQPAVCSFNTSYRPTSSEVVGADMYPMIYVDWCDARAFCSWAGKRLCGKIGGGPVTTEAEMDDMATSQFYRACGSNLPSLDGSGEPATRCNLWGTEPAPVGTTCEGSFPGLFELVGNVAEWQDSCTGTEGALDVCLNQGGNFVPASAYCYTEDEYYRSDRFGTLGFRCCSG